MAQARIFVLPLRRPNFGLPRSLLVLVPGFFFRTSSRQFVAGVHLTDAHAGNSVLLALLALFPGGGPAVPRLYNEPNQYKKHRAKNDAQEMNQAGNKRRHTEKRLGDDTFTPTGPSEEGEEGWGMMMSSTGTPPKHIEASRMQFPEKDAE